MMFGGVEVSHGSRYPAEASQGQRCSFRVSDLFEAVESFSQQSEATRGVAEFEGHGAKAGKSVGDAPGIVIFTESAQALSPRSGRFRQVTSGGSGVSERMKQPGDVEPVSLLNRSDESLLG